MASTSSWGGLVYGGPESQVAAPGGGNVIDMHAGSHEGCPMSGGKHRKSGKRKSGKHHRSRKSRKHHRSRRWRGGCGCSGMGGTTLK